jgi:hypothetical protein
MSSVRNDRACRLSRTFLGIAGVIGPFTSGIALLLLLAVVEGTAQLTALLFSGATWFVGNLAAGCLFLCGLWTQAYAKRWLIGWTAWNVVCLVISLFGGVYAILWVSERLARL